MNPTDTEALKALVAFIKADKRINGDVALTECRKALPALERLLASPDANSERTAPSVATEDAIMAAATESLLKDLMELQRYELSVTRSENSDWKWEQEWNIDDEGDSIMWDELEVVIRKHLGERQV